MNANFRYGMKKLLAISCCTIVFALLLIPIAVYPQTVSKCFNIEKITKLCRSTFLEINATLFQENWEIVANSTHAPFVLENDTILYDNFSQWKFELPVDKWTMSLYRKKDLAPILVWKTSKNCYETLENELKNKKNIRQIIAEDSIKRLHIFQIQQGVDFVLLSRHNKQPYLVTICNYAQIDSLIKSQAEAKKEYVTLLQTQLQFLQNVIIQADSLANRDDFESAFLVLEQAINQHFIEREELGIEFREIQSKMDTLTKELNIKKVNFHTQVADSAFAKEEYATAKEHYRQAQQIDPNSEELTQKLKEIEKIESMFVVRKDSLFNYQTYNPHICNEIQTTIFKKLKTCFLNVDAGELNFSYTLFTDTLGQNSSSYQIHTFVLSPTAKSSLPTDTENDWRLFLDTLITINPIPAVKKDYLFVNATTTFLQQLSWKTLCYKATYGKKMRFSHADISSVEKQKIERYLINKSSSLNGRFTIEKKEIMYQDSTYTTLNLKKFYAVGPEAMAYSMLFPGVGSLAATQGHKGWAAFSTFIGFTTIGVTGFLLSNHWVQKKTYSTSVINGVKYASLGSLCVSGVIYISDIFVALKRGIDNLKKTKVLKENLKENNLYIQELPQHIDP